MWKKINCIDFKEYESNENFETILDPICKNLSQEENTNIILYQNNYHLFEKDVLQLL